MEENTEYSNLGFDPNALSYLEDKLGLIFANEDTALDVLKKHEKVLISELTKMFMNTDYKNTAELNAHIYTSNQYKEFLEHYKNVLGKRNRAKIRYETFKSFRNDLRTKSVNERELAKHI